MAQKPVSTTGASFQITRNGKQEIWNVAIADNDQALAALRAKVGIDAAIERLSDLNAGEIALSGYSREKQKKNDASTFPVT